MGTVLHIPHSSAKFPPGSLDSYGVGEEKVREEARILGDLLTDRLFPAERYPSVLFPWSRLWVDVERFREDGEEPMAGRWMGALYEVGHDLTSLERSLTPEDRERILRAYYDPHHQKLTERVEQEIAATGSALIVDCHSFPAEPLPYETDQRADRPEICIGTDGFHTPPAVAEKLCFAFFKEGFTVALNRPFSGSLVPRKFYRQDRRVSSVMIEVRRDLFLAEDGRSPRNGFEQVADWIERAIREIKPDAISKSGEGHSGSGRISTLRFRT